MSVFIFVGVWVCVIFLSVGCFVGGCSGGVVGLGRILERVCSFLYSFVWSVEGWL